MLLIDDSSTILYNNSIFLKDSAPKSEPVLVSTTPTLEDESNVGVIQMPKVEVLAVTPAEITVQGSPIIYVRQGAGGSGTSWGDAYGDLQTALNNAPPGSEIWVAAGVYKPTGGTDRNATFTLRNTIEVYGGFAGFETDRNQRNVGANVTVLSGDIGTPNNATDNSYRVVTATNLANYAILDGFTITGGNANGSGNNGGGILVQSSNVAFSNLVITENRANGRGGGIYSNSSTTQLSNIFLSINQAGFGGGIFADDNIENDGIQSRVTLNNSLLTQNSARTDGGGIRSFGSELYIFGTAFDRNFANRSGGGIFTTASNVSLINSTFSNNSASSSGGGISLGSVLNRGFVTVNNNIFWGNNAPTNSQLFSQASGSQIQINNNIVQGGYAGGSSNLDADPLFIDAASGNLALQANSPAINRGNNGSVPTNIINDLTGNPRISGGTVDLGAYEFFAFDPASYGASNPDLIPFYIQSGYNLAALTNHYLTYGRFEGRPTDTFDEFRYTASSYVTGGDLINAFGLNGGAATLHYINNGFTEGRPTTAFDPARYLDSYDDLLNAFGKNTAAATQHFITNGFAPDGRNPNLFPSDQYLASYGDLINSFAPITNYAAKIETASSHYLFNGRGEGRQVTFNPFSYLAVNPDVAAAFNNDPTLATRHYIEFGFSEGRPTA